MRERLMVGVLGPLEVATEGGEVIGLGGPKPHLTLAMLVMHRGAVVPSSRLVELLWGHAQPPSASASLQSHISRLRSALTPAITISTRAPGYVLDMAESDLDAARFEALTGDARAAHGPDDASERLGAALALWRGEAYGELGSLEWFQGEARRLDELRLAALEDWIGARLACGDDQPVVGELESLVTQHPLRERFWRQLMLALYRTGRQADAMRRAGAFRSMLRDELGLNPSPTFNELEADILSDAPSLRVLERPTARRRPHLARPPADADPTSFVGRGHAVIDVTTALDRHRFVTVTGPGGVGKTRLARRIATQAAHRFRHGAAVVELAPLRDAAGLGQVIAAALDVQQRQHRSIDETVLEFLRERELLLVLDNCEHVIDVAAGFVQQLLLHCARAKVLATSREPFLVAGEYVHVLAPLVAPSDSETDIEAITTAPAVQLFIDRAAAASPGFALSSENAVAVAAICRRLDGLPLALELAAARLRPLGAAVLAERLDQRFELLGTTRHHVEARQRTLRDLVTWSYDLLDPVEREVFAQLSVFAGTFDLDDATALCRVADDERDVIDVLADLVDKSMVQLADPGVPRYQLLETLREFGHDRLRAEGRATEIHHRHLRWYLDLARRGSEGLDGPDEATWSRLLDAEFDNFRAAHAFAIAQGRGEAAAQLVRDLREQSFRRIRYEAASWADRTLELLAATPEHPLLPVVLGVSAYGYWARGDLEAAMERAERAAALQDHADGAAPTGLPERVMGNALFYLGRPDEALAWMDQMADAARRSGFPGQLAHALYMRSVAQTSVGDSVRGAVLAGEARAASERCGSLTAAAQAEYALGLALQASDPTAAIAHLRSAALRSEAAGNRWLTAFALTEVHWLVARGGDPLEGLRGYAAVIDAWYRGGDRANQWLSLRHVLGILVELGEHTAAAVLHGALTATGAAYALPYEPADAQRLANDVVTVRELLGPAGFASAARQGTAMSDDQIVTYALEQIERLTASVRHG